MAPWFRLAAALGLVLAAGCAAAPPPPPAEEPPVRALRYRQFIVEDALEFSHGGGAWMDQVFLPDAGVVCTVVWESEMVWEEDGTLREILDVPRMEAYPGTLEDELGDRPQDEEDGRRPPEEIRIPAALVRDILALAERTAREWKETERLGAAAVKAGIVGGKDSVRPRRQFR